MKLRGHSRFYSGVSVGVPPPSQSMRGVWATRHSSAEDGWTLGKSSRAPSQKNVTADTMVPTFAKAAKVGHPRCTCKRRIFRLSGRFQEWLRRLRALSGKELACQHDYRQ
jgi:hypothetical protein